MPRRVLVMALLFGGAAAVAAETAPTPVVQAARQMMPGPNLPAASERKATERKGGEALKNSRGTSKPSLPLRHEKNLGLGCAQG